jgi:dTDP-4-dehydrorhamnose 3,5-epimerase
LKISPSTLNGVHIITPSRFGDERGFFSECWNKKALEEQGLDLPEFVQDNHSLSSKAGTLRGLHFQAPPHAQGKLVRCGQGALFDVAVDIRTGSPQYGHWFGTELSAKNGQQLWVPAGFLHGFITLQDNTEVLYKCTDYYNSAADGAVRWDSCGINWGAASPTLSKKDAAAPALADFVSPFKWEGTT